MIIRHNSYTYGYPLSLYEQKNMFGRKYRIFVTESTMSVT